MQSGYPVLQLHDAAVIGNNIVSHCQPLGTACLSGHDGAHLGLGQAVARHHSGDLQCLGAINHGNAIKATTTCVFVDPGLDEQGNHHHHVRYAGSPGVITPGIADAANHGMQNAFKPGALGWVGKNQAAHGTAIKRTIGADDGFAKCGFNGRHGGTTGAGQFMSDRIGINYRSPQTGKVVGRCTFAAADAASEANQQSLHGAAQAVLTNDL